MFNVHVYVRMKKGLLDPQGKAIEGALKSLGYDQIQDVSVGKLIEMKIKAKTKAEAGKKIEEMSKKLLANPVIEIFNYEIEDIRQAQSKEATSK